MVTSICMSVLQQIIHVGKHKSKRLCNSTYHIMSDENIVKMMWAITWSQICVYVHFLKKRMNPDTQVQWIKADCTFGYAFTWYNI